MPRRPVPRIIRWGRVVERGASPMLTAVAVALPAAVGLALAALPVVLIPVALATRRPPDVARSFLAGWLLGVCAVGGVVIVLADVLVLPGAGDAAWPSYLKIVL